MSNKKTKTKETAIAVIDVPKFHCVIPLKRLFFRLVVISGVMFILAQTIGYVMHFMSLEHVIPFYERKLGLLQEVCNIVRVLQAGSILGITFYCMKNFRIHRVTERSGQRAAKNAKQKAIQKRFRVAIASAVLFLSFFLGFGVSGQMGMVLLYTESLMVDDVDNQDELNDSYDDNDVPHVECVKIGTVDIFYIWFMRYYMDLCLYAFAGEIRRGIIKYINNTAFVDTSELTRIYQELVVQTDELERKTRESYSIRQFEGNLNLSDNAIEIHRNWSAGMLEAMELREIAGRQNATFENFIEIASYCISLGDAFLWMGELRLAYSKYLMAYEHLILSIQLAVSDTFGEGRVRMVLRKLIQLFNEDRLQNPILLRYKRADSASTEVLEATQKIFRELVEEVHRLDFGLINRGSHTTDDVLAPNTIKEWGKGSSQEDFEIKF